MTHAHFRLVRPLSFFCRPHVCVWSQAHQVAELYFTHGVYDKATLKSVVMSSASPAKKVGCAMHCSSALFHYTPRPQTGEARTPVALSVLLRSVRFLLSVYLSVICICSSVLVFLVFLVFF
jgi:hypothetical protein